MRLGHYAKVDTCGANAVNLKSVTAKKTKAFEWNSELVSNKTDTATSQLVDVFKNRLLALLSHDQKMAEKQTKYLELAFNRALELPPELAQGIHKEISVLDKTS